jgi:hypothetical protein
MSKQFIQQTAAISTEKRDHQQQQSLEQCSNTAAQQAQQQHCNSNEQAIYTANNSNFD